MSSELATGLANVAIQELPAIIDWIRSAHAQANPGTPAPTDAEVVAALNAAVDSSVAKDDAWKAAHPEV